MVETLSEGESSELKRSSVRLSFRKRMSCGLLGVLQTGAGSLAVFQTENSVGASTLLLLGSAFILLGLSGVMPWKIRAGDYEIEISELVENVMDAVPTERAGVAVEVLDFSGEKSPAIAQTAMARYVAYETSVRNALERLFPTPAHTLNWGGTGLGADAVLRKEGAQAFAAIEVKYRSMGRHIGAKDVILFGEKMQRVASEEMRPHIRPLVIANVGPTSAAQQYLDERQRGHLVVWTGPQDDEKLRAVIVALLSDPV